SECRTIDDFRGHARFYRLKARETSGVVFKPGETEITIQVPVNPDSRAHPTRNFFVNLSNPVHAMIADNQGRATILNDIAPPDLHIDDTVVTEGNSGTTDAILTVTLSNASADIITVNWKTIDSSALAPSDYLAASGILTFAPGVTNHTITNKVV